MTSVNTILPVCNLSIPQCKNQEHDGKLHLQGPRLDDMHLLLHTLVASNAEKQAAAQSQYTKEVSPGYMMLWDQQCFSNPPP